MSNLCITDGSMSDLCIIVSNQNMCDGIERLGMCGQLLMAATHNTPTIQNTISAML